MTNPQRITMMADWWPKACAVQGWRLGDRELRLRVLSLAVSFAFTTQLEFREALAHYGELRARPNFREIVSANELNETTDVDVVKRVLLLLGDDLPAAREVAEPERGEGRRYRKILAEQMRCLALYPLEQPMGLAGAAAYVQEILNDKFNRARRHEVMTLEDLSDRPQFSRLGHSNYVKERPSQVKQLMLTVAARLNGKRGFRAAAGHSMHDMLTRAELPCHCKQCEPGRVTLVEVPEAATVEAPF